VFSSIHCHPNAAAALGAPDKFAAPQNIGAAWLQWLAADLLFFLRRRCYRRPGCQVKRLKQHFREHAELIDRRFTEVHARFAEIHARFTAQDRRFEAVDARFIAFDSRFTAIDAQFSAVHRRFEAMDGRFEAMDERFNRVDHEIGLVRQDIAGVHDAVNRILQKLNAA
jgi:hypothetical protein